MSVRAYKIKKIEYSDQPAFNLWHDDEIVDLLDIYSNDALTEGGGTIYISKDQIEDALGEAKEEKTKQMLKDMLKDLGEDDGADYICF